VQKQKVNLWICGFEYLFINVRFLEFEPNTSQKNRLCELKGWLCVGVNRTAEAANCLLIAFRFLHFARN